MFCKAYNLISDMFAKFMVRNYYSWMLCGGLNHKRPKVFSEKYVRLYCNGARNSVLVPGTEL